MSFVDLKKILIGPHCQFQGRESRYEVDLAGNNTGQKSYLSKKKIQLLFVLT